MIISNFYVLTEEYHMGFYCTFMELTEGYKHTQYCACIVKGTSMETKFFMCKHVVIKAEYFDSDKLVSVCM